MYLVNVYEGQFGIAWNNYVNMYGTNGDVDSEEVKEFWRKMKAEYGMTDHYGTPNIEFENEEAATLFALKFANL